jgi:hypothetical protein
VTVDGAITAAAAPAAEDDGLSSTEHWAARFLEAARTWDTDFDYEKSPECQGETVKAAMAEHKLALTRLANDRAGTPRDIGVKLAVALDLLPPDDCGGQLRAVLASALIDLRLLEFREARSKGN